MNDDIENILQDASPMVESTVTFIPVGEGEEGNINGYKEVEQSGTLREPGKRSRERNVRDGRRTHHDIGAESSINASSRPIMRENEIADDERHDDYIDLDPLMGDSFLIIPKYYVNMFQKKGFVIRFFHQDQFWARKRLGFTPVTLEELPEWSAAGLPVSGSLQNLEENYCRSLDQILMKIKIDLFDRLTRNLKNKVEKNKEIIGITMDNDINYRRGRVGRESLKEVRLRSPSER